MHQYKYFNFQINLKPVKVTTAINKSETQAHWRILKFH